MASKGVWDYTDLQSRYDRAQILANDCTQDFAGNYFFPSDRSPRGFWKTTRRQRLDYVCDCPDFARLIDQQITNFAPSRWVRNDWSTNPDNRILVNRCLHCLAVAIAAQEVDPSFPVNRIYQAKRDRYPKTDCGCGCGGSGDCGCPNKELGLPEPRLIQGCETDCYVEPLTPRTQRTPSTNEGIPAYQTFEIQRVEFAQTQYQGCFGDKVTLRLRRSTLQGFNNATVVGLPVDIEFPFSPEFRTSSQEITLDFYGPGIYTIGIGAIAVGNFGDLLEAQIEILDCGNNLDNIDCPEDEFVDFGGGKCEGSYLVGFRQTGNKNPDGSCEILKVLKFEEGLDCPPPDSPPIECESTIPRNCPPTRIGAPKCVNTGSGDGFNSNAGFNAVVKVQTGGKRTEYLRPDKKECAEYCEFAELAINVPSCPDPPPKPTPPATCGYAKRYIGWGKYDPATGDYRDVTTGRVNFGNVGTAIVETFTCDDGTTYGLRAYTARCVPPSNRVLDDFAAANYQGNEFGEGCCPFDETKPPHPACPPVVTKWSCSGGVCSLDANGTYNSQAECQAALIPPLFTGGQCVGKNYRIQVAVTYTDGTFYGTLINGVLAQSTTPLTDAQMRTSGKNVLGAISSVTFGTVQFNGKFIKVNGIENDGTSFGFALARNFNTYQPLSIAVYRIITTDGSADNCGDPPSTCP
jgi:hypothetical protein